ncbi:hypothetical protein [Acetobacter conturbans]|uniref:Uncharacterized protein n=1 Tax=Acetobacter conturbans TaxID=1737472 RepID=A0ABX0K0Y4_9PROT|nr:hypothetical protein [Acetobacter conturbans]NHN87399.1 hypothetical protein [Acetobacter conturbans]
MSEDPELISKVESVILGCAITSPADAPETIAATTVLAVCRYLGVPSADVPETVLTAMKGDGPSDGEAG